MKKLLKNTKGYALVFVILLIGLVSVLGFTVSLILGNESSFLATRDENVGATYAAQAGLDHMCAILGNNYAIWPPTTTVILYQGEGYKTYYTIRRYSYNIVSSSGYYEKGGTVVQTVSVIARVDQQGGVVIL